jgi:hypothetical protein
MGVVCTAYDPKLDRKVAIKLTRSLASASVERARADAPRGAGDGPPVAPERRQQVYEVGEHKDELFIAMEFVRGDLLAVARRRGPRDAARRRASVRGRPVAGWRPPTRPGWCTATSSRQRAGRRGRARAGRRLRPRARAAGALAAGGGDLGFAGSTRSARSRSLTGDRRGARDAGLHVARAAARPGRRRRASDQFSFCGSPEGEVFETIRFLGAGEPASPGILLRRRRAYLACSPARRSMARPVPWGARCM